MIKILPSYLAGQWVTGTGEPKPILHAINGSVVSLVNTDGLDFSNALNYARDHGHNLRRLDFHQRALMVKAVAKHLFDNKDLFYPISYQTGATKSDSWIDIEGGINTLFAISNLSRKYLPATSIAVEDDIAMLSKGGTFIGKHILTPKAGVALHINAFNFPCWGMLEKLAANWIAGVPAIIKPASDTAYLTQAMVQVMLDSGLLPEGALQLISGSLGDTLDSLDSQDTLTFTGSASTALIIKSKPNLLAQAVAVNIEADSLNACVLGLDVKPNDVEFDLFINEIANEISTKAGQRCTCIRRIFVPSHLESQVVDRLSALLATKQIGDPNQKNVDIGALISHKQVAEVQQAIQTISNEAEVVFVGNDKFIADRPQDGAFHPITLLRSTINDTTAAAHSVEVFGPVSTIFSYSNTQAAVAMIKAGKGSLVSSIFSNDIEHMAEWVSGIAAYHGRLLLINRDNAQESTGHGTVMPHMIHGGPGRAGGGEELGGIRSINHYMQRTGIQASPDILSKITGQWITGSKVRQLEQHPFKKYYQDLQLGDSLLTHKRTITEADIVNFAGISGDHFYAHYDAIAAKNSMFKARVAHGYFIISAAAGLFVHPNEGPVLGNYGLEKLRFIEPVYIGDTIQVRLTFIRKNTKQVPADSVPQGVVYWDVAIFNQNNQLVASYEILTLVAKRKE